MVRESFGQGLQRLACADHLIRSAAARPSAEGAPRRSEEVPEHPDMETYVPNDEEAKLILNVNEAGAEYKKMHEKLTKLFDRVRPSVQALKDNPPALHEEVREFFAHASARPDREKRSRNSLR